MASITLRLHRKIVLVFLLLSIYVSALHTQPADLARVGGAVFIGASKCKATKADLTPCRPRWGVGYRLYEPANDNLKWFGLTGFVGPEVLGLATVLRFPPYHTESGRLITFSIGPGYAMPLNGNGFNSGRFGGLFYVTVKVKTIQ